jgi:hypothetical protein
MISSHAPERVKSYLKLFLGFVAANVQPMIAITAMFIALSGGAALVGKHKPQGKFSQEAHPDV